MKQLKLWSDQARTFLLVFEKGDRFPDKLLEFAERENVVGAHLRAIGAFERATIAYWNRESKKYENKEITEQVEVVSLIGSITRFEDGSARVHAHATLGTKDLEAIAGHLVSGIVFPTLELFITDLGTPIPRRTDDETGLTLIALE